MTQTDGEWIALSPLNAELFEILKEHVGESGESEGMADVVRRIIRERDEWKRIAAVNGGLHRSAEAEAVRMRSALVRIRDRDYRGNRCSCSTIAFRALEENNG